MSKLRCAVAHRDRRIVEHHAGQQLFQLLGVHRVLAADLVDLRHVLLRRGEAVDQRAVVGEQQQAGGVFVEPAHRLHLAPAQRAGQQVHHARVVLGLLRTLVAGRLVQQHQRLLEVRPGFAAHGELQPGGGEFLERIVAGPAVHGDEAGDDQSLAFAPRAETLREQDLGELQANTPAVSCMRADTSPRWCNVSPKVSSITVRRLK